jgi:hypothetical protein
MHCVRVRALCARVRGLQVLPPLLLLLVVVVGDAVCMCCAAAQD